MTVISMHLNQHAISPLANINRQTKLRNDKIVGNEQNVQAPVKLTLINEYFLFYCKHSCLYFRHFDCAQCMTGNITLNKRICLFQRCEKNNEKMKEEQRNEMLDRQMRSLEPIKAISYYKPGSEIR